MLRKRNVNRVPEPAIGAIESGAENADKAAVGSYGGRSAHSGHYPGGF